MLNRGPNKVCKNEDHYFLYVPYCCSWEQVGGHQENLLGTWWKHFQNTKIQKKMKKGLKLNVEIFIF
jgi:hypothetical protein